MLNINLTDGQLLLIKEFLDEIHFSFIDEILSDRKSFFPPFTSMHTRIKSSVNEPFAFYFSLLRLGHSSSQSHINQFLPNSVFQALVDLGLLVKNYNNEWSTPGLSILSSEGAYILSPLPSFYPSSKKDFTYPDYFTKAMSFQIPQGVKNILEISPSDFGLMSISFLRRNEGGNATVYAATDIEQNLITVSSRLNGVGHLVCTNSIDSKDLTYDFIFANCKPIDVNFRFQPKYTHLKNIEELFKRTLLKKGGEFVINLTVTGENNSIPHLKELVIKIKNELNLNSRILVFEKIPAPVFFDTCYKQLYSDDWSDVAGFNKDHYKMEYDLWLNKFENNVSDATVYKLLWRLSDNFDITSFRTLYKLQNTDPLYALSFNNN